MPDLPGLRSLQAAGEVHGGNAESRGRGGSDRRDVPQEDSVDVVVDQECRGFVGSAGAEDCSASSEPSFHT